MSADRQQEKKAWNHQNEKKKTLNNWKIQFSWMIPKFTPKMGHQVYLVDETNEN